MLQKLKRAIFGGPKDVRDPHAFHQLSLIALFAWVGLGADGLSSSAYGPDEAFRQLGSGRPRPVALELPPDVLAASTGAGTGEFAEPSPVPPSEADVERAARLLLAAKRNADQGYADLALFEIGPQYRDDSETGQALVAAGIRVGRMQLKSWDAAAQPVGPFDVKADVMAALGVAGVPMDNLQVTADPPDWYHPGRAGCVRLSSTPRRPAMRETR